jgi:predicted TIM-barrel fold metal-dependent hydrolase
MNIFYKEYPLMYLIIPFKSFGSYFLTLMSPLIIGLNLNSVHSQEKKIKTLRENLDVAERSMPSDVQPNEFIDGHVHLNDVEMQLILMKDYKIPRAVVFWGRNSSDESLLKAASEHPDRLIPFVSVSPEREKYRKLWDNNDSELLKILETQLKTGLYKGIGEISVTHFPGLGFPEADYDPKSYLMTGIMKLADKYQVPNTIHCEITKIKEFSDILDKFKSVKVIWAHGEYTPYFLAKRMLKKHSNLYYELSARTWSIILDQRIILSYGNNG